METWRSSPVCASSTNARARGARSSEVPRPSETVSSRTNMKSSASIGVDRRAESPGLPADCSSSTFSSTGPSASRAREKSRSARSATSSFGGAGAGQHRDRRHTAIAVSGCGWSPRYSGVGDGPPDEPGGVLKTSEAGRCRDGGVRQGRGSRSCRSLEPPPGRGGGGSWRRSSAKCDAAGGADCPG